MKHLVIVPAYNEERALPQTIESLQGLPESYEILVVNDGSLDRTGEVAERLARKSTRRPMHVVHLPLNGGIGVAVQTGYLYAARHGGFAYVIQCDADGQHDPVCIPALVEECERRNLDLCIGSRFVTPAQESFRSTFARRQGIRILAWLIGILSGVRVTDPTSGLRCAGRRAWSIFADNYPEDFPEPESLFWCARHRMQVGEIPVQMYDRQGGTSSIYGLGSFYYMVKVMFAIVFDRLRAAERNRL